MKTNSLRIPFIILVIGLVLSVIAYLLSSVIMVPTITEHDFNFKVTYNLNGETQIIEGVYRSHFEGSGEGISPLERYYYGTVLTNESETHPLEYTIDKKDGLELRIVLCFSDDYLMGDVEEEDERFDPYLAVYDKRCVI